MKMRPIRSGIALIQFFLIVSWAVAPGPAIAQVAGNYWGTWIQGDVAFLATLPGTPVFLEELLGGDLLIAPTAASASAATRAAHPGVDLRMRSELVGGLGVPQLRLYSGADTTVGFYNVRAMARALQRYEFTGAVPQTYTLDVVVDATMTGMAGYSGFVRVWDERYDPELEDEVSEILASTVFSRSFGGAAIAPIPVSFTLVPGDVVFVQARIAANAQNLDRLPAIADLDHTVTLAFRDGTNLEAASVPEPSLGALLGAGIAILGALGRSSRSDRQKREAAVIMNARRCHVSP